MTGKKKTAPKKAAKKATKPKAKAAPAPKNASVTASTMDEAIRDRKLIERKGISLWDPAAVVATVFSVGRIPIAPGTWGSLVGVVYFPVFLLCSLYVSLHTPAFSIFAIFTAALLVVLYCIGIMAVKSYQSKTKTHDAPEIVYDEFFGQIFTYTLAYAGLFFIMGPNSIVLTTDRTHALIYQFVPFLFFRLFDICKPWPINIVDSKENSAWGVMFDDVLAACYAAAASVVVFLFLNNYI